MLKIDFRNFHIRWIIFNGLGTSVVTVVVIIFESASVVSVSAVGVSSSLRDAKLRSSLLCALFSWWNPKFPKTIKSFSYNIF